MMMMLVLVAGCLVYISGGINLLNASKLWLGVKDRCNSEAEIEFAGKLTSEGQPYMGFTINSSLCVRQFVKEKAKV